MKQPVYLWLGGGVGEGVALIPCIWPEVVRPKNYHPSKSGSPQDRERGARLDT